MDRTQNRIIIDFFDQDEKDFFLVSFGYMNMNFIKPYDFSRILRCFSIHIVIGGCGYVTMANQTFRIEAGECFAIPPNTKFFLGTDDNNKWEYIWFKFSGNCAENYYKNLGFDIDNPTQKCKKFKCFVSKLDDILGRYEDGATIGYYKMVSLFYEFLDANINLIKRKNPNVTDRAIEYVSSHCHEKDLTVEKICSVLNVSHSHLSRIFKENKGVTLKKFIIQKRLESACRLLRESKLGIKEIANLVGFGDSVHFAKTFKNYMKTSPQNYRLYRNTRDYQLCQDEDDLTEFVKKVNGTEE